MSLRKEKNGLSISAKVFSDDERIIAQIINNEFYINPNNYFRRDRPDPHSLSVYDQQGHRVVSIRYLNPKAIKVLGIFRFAGHTPVRVTEQEVRFGGQIHRSSCFGFLDDLSPLRNVFPILKEPPLEAISNYIAHKNSRNECFHRVDRGRSGVY